MALGASAPEIFICFYSTFSDIGGTPNQIGPIVLIGSASFNLLVGSGIAILAASEVKRVHNLCQFLTTAAFATVTYVWLFLSLLVISPGVIEIKEAVITLLGYPFLIIVIWLTDKISESPYTDEETEKKRVCQSYLRNLAEQHGPGYVLDINRLIAPCADFEEIQQIKQCFRICLGVDDLNDVSLDELASVLEPENPVDRIQYRRGASGSQNNKRPFTKLKQAQITRPVKQSQSKLVGFKQGRYLVREGDEVAITIQKTIKQDLTFCIETIDDVAIANEDYVPVSMMMTMQANETEREIFVQINKTYGSKIQDREFHVVVKDDLNQDILEGNDTMTTLEINDCDDPGYLAFEQEFITPKEFASKLPIKVKRFGGAFGEASVFLSTVEEHKRIDIGNRARPGVHYKPLECHHIVFDDCQEEKIVEIELIEYSIDTMKMSFVLELSLPNELEMSQYSVDSFKSDKTIQKKARISKRNQCIVSLGETDALRQDIHNRTTLLRQFLKDQERGWFQFKKALVLQPNIDEDDIVTQPSGFTALVHLVQMPWKFVFAVIPPVSYFGGWVTFCISLILIGLLSFMVFEMITSIGCLLDIHIGLQALTLIAVGANFPDLVANYFSASDKNNQNADTALQIITATNAVNVLVGLGLPWTIATIYHWQQSGQDFYVGKYETAETTFILILFFFCSILAVFTLVLRRLSLGGELGGPRFGRICSASFLFFLWGLFIVMSGLYTAGSLGPYEVFVPQVAIKATALNTCPDSISAPIVYEKSGDVGIRWQYSPETIGVNQCRVELEVPESAGAGIDITRFCDCVPGSLIQDSAECQIPHEYLSLDFGFPTCHAVNARVQVYYNNCWSDFSDWSDDTTVRVQGCPDQLVLEATEVYDTSVAINWDDYVDNLDSTCNNIQSYTLEYKHAGGDFREIDENLNAFVSTFRQFGLQPCTEYVFRGKAKSSTCIGLYSEHLSVTTTGSCYTYTAGVGQGSSSMGAIQANLAPGCMVNFDWEEPIGNLVYTDYQIEVRGKNYSYYQIPCVPAYNACSVPMSTFGETPFFLEPADHINVKGKALSQYGWSDYSTAWNALTYAEGPLPVQVVVTGQTDTSVTLDWGTYSSHARSSYATYDVQQSADGQNWQDLVSDTFRTSYTKSGLQYDANSFRVRALDFCGVSDWSQPTTPNYNTFSTSLPSMVTGVSSYNVDCTAVVRWAEPSTSEQITGYLIEVKAAHGAFLSQDGLCIMSGSNYCTFNMDILAYDPYFLADSDPIVVRIAAVASAGTGPVSMEISNGALMVSPPADLETAPWLLLKTPNSVTIQWSNVNGADESNSYEIYWMQGSTNSQYQYTKLDDTTQSVFTANIYDQSSAPNLYFKVRARSICGVGNFSPELMVSLGNVPAQMSSITNSIVDCQLRLSWVEPINNGSPIESYKIEISKDGVSWQLLTTACDNQTGISYGQCVTYVEMSILQSFPYDYYTGDLLYIRGSAQNSQGWGTPSYVASDGIQMIAAPQQMGQVWVQQTLDTGLVIVWGDAFECGRNCGSDYQYELQWDNGNNNGFTRLTETTATSFTVSGLHDNRNLSFRVRAHNPCGYGPYSSELPVQFVKPDQRPHEMAAPLVQADDCHVNVIWQRPEDGGSPILGYRLEIKDPVYERYESLQVYCGRSPNTNSCVVPMTVLAQNPFNMEQGDLVQIRISAYNSQGESPQSDLSSSYVHVATMDTTIGNLSIVGQSGNTVTFAWDSIYSNEQIQDTRYLYELFSDNGSSMNAFTKVANTLQNSYLVQGLSPGTYYFQVRARTPCGEQDFSNTVMAQIININQEPGKMQPLFVEQQDCFIKVSWIAPDQGSAPIVGYQLNIATPYNNFRDITSVCGSMLYTSNCVIPMQLLNIAPFSLQDGDPVQFTAAAINDNGVGAMSEVNENAPLMVSEPRIANTPILVEQTSNHVTIGWESHMASDAKYELFWDYGRSGRFEKLTDTYDTVYTIPVDANGSYQFRVRAKNDCGIGDYSPTLTIDFQGLSPATPPGQILQVNTETQGCSVKISWDEPGSDGGGDIIGYEIEVRDAYGQFHPIESNLCGYSAQTYCVVPMSVLKGSPWLLIDNELVAVQAYAVNSRGPSPYPSPTNTLGSVIQTRPNLVQSLQGVRDADTITLAWDPVFGLEDAANSNFYEVYWDNGGSSFAFLAATSETAMVVENIVRSNVDYKFKVRAFNSCGSSDFSEDLVISAGTVPGQMESVRSTQDGCSMRFTWTPQAVTGSAQITMYDVEVMNPMTRMFHSLGDWCGKEEVPGTTCLVPMSVLTASPYYLGSGDVIEARILAFNANGWSPPSMPQTGGQVTSVPFKMFTPVVYSSQLNHITIEWPSLDLSDNVSYEIFIKSPGQTSWERVTETEDLAITLQNSAILSGQEYSVSIRATNECGPGPYSDEVVVRTSSLPAAISDVEVTRPVGSCKVHIAWSDPSQVQSFPVTGYEISIRTARQAGGELEYSSENLTCGTNPAETSCLIDMTTLQEDPYNLENGHVIVARVAAINEFGIGEAVETVSDVYINSIPAQMNKPGIEPVGTSDDRVKLTWNPLYHSSDTGGTDLLEYRLFWDEGSLPALTSRITIYDTSTTSHVLSVTDHPEYSFAIQAVNVCGDGPMSDILSIQQSVDEDDDETAGAEADQDRLADDLEQDRIRNEQQQLEYLIEQATLAREAAEQALALAEEAADAAYGATSRAEAEEALQLALEAAEAARIASEAALAAQLEQEEADRARQEEDERAQQEEDSAAGSESVTVDEQGGDDGRAGNMNPVRVRVVGCSVRLDWVAPKHFEQENIEDYLLEVSTSTALDTWETLSIVDCSNSLNFDDPTWVMIENSCIVSMNVLNERFGLGDNDELLVKAKASYQPASDYPNQEWSHDYSDDSDPVSLIGRPARVANLQVIEIIDGVELSWDTWIGNYMYEIWWCEGDCSAGYEKVSETAAGAFELNLLGVRGEYQFIVRARSPCGEGMFSDVVSVEIQAVPSQVQDIKVYEQAQDCGVILRWSRPLIGEPIRGYNTEIQGNDGDWHGIDCGDDPSAAMCTISMQTLQLSPYRLPVSAQVFARAQAHNDFGTGPYSDPNDDITDPGPVYVKAVPGKMPAIQGSLTTNDDEIRIYWPLLEIDGSSVESYDLVWDEGSPENDVNVRLVDTASRFYILGGLQRGQQYRFAVRARNSCGYGEFSDAFILQLQRVPHQMDMVRTSYTQIPELSGNVMGCGVVLTWVAPDDGGSDIISYLVEIQRPRDGDWYPLSSCGRSPDDTSCQVVMNDLTNSMMFDLRQNDPIVVRAAAYNAVGMGPVSSPSDGQQRIAGPPGQTEPPRMEYFDNESITLVWDAVLDGNGGRDIQSYSLFWNAGVGGEADVNNQIMDDNVLTYTVNGLQPDKEYIFKIRARNACGYGVFSREVRFQTAGCPNAPSRPPLVELDGTEVLISWEEPIPRDSQDEILGYQVVFMTVEGRYQEISDCDGASDDVVTGRQCRVDMMAIPDYTGLNAGSLIKVKVRARNQHCPGPFSTANDIGQVVITCPQQMQAPFFLPEEIFETAITIRWDSPQSFEAGGVGQEITQFEVQVKPTPATEWKDPYIWQTRNLQFTQTGLRNDFSYSYRVRAWNELECPGEWSEPIHVVTGVLPAKLEAPTTSAVEVRNDEWKVRIGWNPPSNYDGTIPIVKYTVKIGTSRPDIGYVESDQCNGEDQTVIDDAECYVDMSQFWQGTHLAEQGTIIMATVSAWNIKGQGATSDPGGRQAVEHIPGEMKQPCGERDADVNEVGLYWDLTCVSQVELDDEGRQEEIDDGGTGIESYVLEYKESSGPNEQDTDDSQWRNLIESNARHTARSYTHDLSSESPPAVGYLQYRIAARNRWGTGPWCWPHLEVADARPPERTNTPDSTVDTVDGYVKIEWEMPNGNGITITSYTVEIQNANDDWLATDECQIAPRLSQEEEEELRESAETTRTRMGSEPETAAELATGMEEQAPETTIYQSTYGDGRHLYCRIDMRTLTGEYGLPFDETIKIRVRAVNYAGPAEAWSVENIDGARTRQAPGEVQNLVQVTSADFQDSQFNFIQLAWSPLTSADETGNSIIFDYSITVHERNDALVSSQQVARTLNAGSSTGYILYYADEDKGTRYEFQVLARNIYGDGPLSDILYVHTGDRPDPVTSLRTTNQGRFNIQIKWEEGEETEDNGYPIDDYELEILNKASNAFVSVFESWVGVDGEALTGLCEEASSAAVITNKTCTIDARNLTNHVYGYRSGDSVVVRIKAHNQAGWGDWSIPDTTGATVYELVRFVVGGN